MGIALVIGKVMAALYRGILVGVAVKEESKAHIPLERRHEEVVAYKVNRILEEKRQRSERRKPVVAAAYNCRDRKSEREKRKASSRPMRFDDCANHIMIAF